MQARAPGLAGPAVRLVRPAVAGPTPYSSLSAAGHRPRVGGFAAQRMMNPSFVLRASSTTTEGATKDEETFTYQAEVRPVGWSPWSAAPLTWIADSLNCAKMRSFP